VSQPVRIIATRPTGLRPVGARWVLSDPSGSWGAHRLLVGDRRRRSEGWSMSINRTRGSLYRLARMLGDVQAVKRGRVGRRVGRRVVGRYLGRGMGRLFR
jgi:hypothetical protein